MPDPDLLGEGRLISIKPHTRIKIPYEYVRSSLHLDVRASSLINVILVRDGEIERVTAENAAQIGAMIYSQVPGLSLYIKQLPGSWSLDTGWKLIFENVSKDPVAISYSLKMVW